MLDIIRVLRMPLSKEEWEDYEVHELDIESQFFPIFSRETDLEEDPEKESTVLENS